MKHAASRQLFAYWQERRGKRAAPERAEIEPGAIRQVLSDAFILALDAGAGHPFRLAGTRVCALFGRELKGEPFVGLWPDASQPIIADLLAILDQERVGTVAAVTAQAGNGEPIELELLLLPLGASRPSLARAIGVLAPLKIPPWLGLSPLGDLALGSRRHIGASVETRILPRFMAPRRRHLVVYEGGRG
ncbi:MAG TPA: PAS domain-containing protein [Xanthobacteraceae bacterium]|nr:PAS domain-containing protein [Xanthobacteraceae bacterium]